MDPKEDLPALPTNSATPESLLIERSGNDAVSVRNRATTRDLSRGHFAVRC
jgi:hypothetical protein